MTGEAPFGCLVSTLLRGRNLYVVVINAYIDESIVRGMRHEIITVAADLYEAQKAIELNAKLDESYQVYQVPYFHMTRCEGGLAEKCSARSWIYVIAPPAESGSIACMRDPIREIAGYHFGR